MKKETLQQRADIINKSLHYIYKYIETNITLEELANLNNISKFHFHRIFKDETKENFSNILTSIRLQKAANLLISNEHSTITEISNSCGYSSHSSFIKAFKKRFNFTPTQWKNGAFNEYSKNIIDNKYFKDLNIEATIKVKEEINCAYIRHKGYSKDIKYTWERLRALAFQNNIQDYEEIGLHHDNPSITPLEHCNYVAAITIPKNMKLKNIISTLIIPKSLCAVFKYSGEYGDIINLIRYIHHEWIKDKGYEITILPTYIKYIKNHLIEKGNFEIEVNVPIRVI
ncbi:GyrI-like domain-containing protein [Poseidonibacter lekithochrous]|uniref:AraC family transcriptional regulator n=1 Tax=Poseidonibacter TaxID=2321187 RepID=UPI001C0928D2|nr:MULTISPECIES: GyrI-like domain-containing protein [Poseidonibacter]MBU3013742.1 GyrI-like domain-containing protein [Poseidonibacter lekithochrous]MDO6827039.1 GyrI-like domain-containing protein [Poseidonibacter sp. 1_MG-2023]